MPAPIVTDEIWTPSDGLPGRRVLSAIADRLYRAWDFDPATAPSGGVRVAYNPRLRTTLGRAMLDEDRVELNTRLLRENQAELPGLLAHELAHVVVHVRHGSAAPHGRQFGELMRKVGLSPKATHSLPTGRLRRRRRRHLYLHRCSDCGYSFVARRVRRECYCIACGPDMAWDIYRVPNNAEGQRALAEMAGQCT